MIEGQTTEIKVDDLEEYINDVIEEKVKFLKTYDGIVMNNVDPDGAGAVQVMIHDLGWLLPDQWVWAEPEFAFPGSFSVPKPTSEVKVYFDQGNVENPRYKGTMYYQNSPPGSLPTDGSIFASPILGMNMVYDELSALMAWDTGVSKIELELAGYINIEASPTNYIEVDAVDGVFLSAGATGFIEVKTTGQCNVVANPGTYIEVDPVGGITLATGDSAAWQPCVLPACVFSGAPHGGAAAGIVRLKGG